MEVYALYLIWKKYQYYWFNLQSGMAAVGELNQNELTGIFMIKNFLKLSGLRMALDGVRLVTRPILWICDV
jgi:hypothetical protein